MNSNTKIILLSIVRALWMFLSLAVVTVFVMSIAFPKNLADITYNLGMKQLSLIYYNSAHKSSDKIEDAYFMVNFSNQMQKNDMIEYYYSKLESYDNFNNFIDLQIQKEIDFANNIFDLSIVLNKKELMQQSYVSALIANDKFDNAKEYSASQLVKDLDNNMTIINYSFTIHLLFEDNNNQDLYEYLNDLFGNNFVASVLQYFDNNYNHMINNIDNNSPLFSAQKISVFFRLNNIANVLEKLNETLGDESIINIQDINTKLESLANVMQIA